MATGLALGLGLALARPARAVPGFPQSAAFRKAKEEYFYKRRALKDGSFPPQARALGIAAASKLPLSRLQFRRVLRSRLRPQGAVPSPTFTVPASSWVFVGPMPIQENPSPTNDGGFTKYGVGNASLRINAIAVDPNNPNIVYIGTSFGGVAKSADGGATWTYLTDGLPSQEISSIVIDTTNSHIIYVGTGDPYYDPHGSDFLGVGVYRSTDSGNSWLQLGQNVLGGQVVRKLAIDPATSGSQSNTILYAAVSGANNPGFYKSADSGQTWTNILLDQGFDVAVDTTQPGTLYYCAGNGLGKSTDHGATWAGIPAGVPTGEKCHLAMSGSTIYYTDAEENPTPNPLYSYSSNGNPKTSGRLFVSTNAGTSFSELAAARGFCKDQCYYDQYVAVDPAHSNRIFLGGADASSSTDSGAAFINYAPFNPPNMIIHSDHHALAFAPSDTNIIYEGNDGGIYKSADGGQTWSNLNANLPGGLIVGLGVSGDGHAIAGFQDNGSALYAGAGTAFTALADNCGGDSGYDKIDPGNSQKLYCTLPAYSSTTFAGLVNGSSDGGGHLADITPPGALNLETFFFYPTVFMNPANSADVILGFQNVWRSADSGTNGTWTQIGGLRAQDGGNIAAVAEAPSNSDVLYASAGKDLNYADIGKVSTNGHVYVTANAHLGAGATWTQCTAGLPTGQLPTAFAVHPTDPNTAYVVFSQYGSPAAPLQHVYKTTNGTGACSWTSVSAGLPDVPFNDILIDTASPGNLIAASDVGVFNSIDGGATWAQASLGLPDGVIANALSFHPGTRELVVGTYGRGAYKLTLPLPPPAPTGLAGQPLGISSITWSWTPSAAPYNVQSYGVYYDTSPTTLIASTAGAAYAWTGLSPNTTYSVQVTAANGVLESANSSGASAVTLAAVPTNLALTLLSGASLSAAWSGAGNPSDTSYELSASTDNFALNFSTPLAFTPEPSNSAAFSGLTTGTTVYVRVRAENRAGTPTAFSSVVSILMAPELTAGVSPSAGASLAFSVATLDVPAGAFAQAVSLTLKTPASYPGPASNAGSLSPTAAGIEIDADPGLQPQKSLTLTLDYSGVAGITDPSRVVIARYDSADALWAPLPSTPDVAAKRVSAVIDHLSLYQVMQQTPASSLSSASISVFPDPVYVSRGQAMSFTGLPSGANLTVYTFRGDQVRSFSANAGGMAVWDGKNDSGIPAASGVYLVRVNSGGDKKVLKVMVER